MGNHRVGTAFDAAAEVFWDAVDGAVPTREKAISILDKVGERFRGADAEFADYARPRTPLGRLIAVAFDATPAEIANEETEDGDSPWYDGPETRFRKRYRFC